MHLFSHLFVFTVSNLESCSTVCQKYDLKVFIIFHPPLHTHNHCCSAGVNINKWNDAFTGLVMGQFRILATSSITIIHACSFYEFIYLVKVVKTVCLLSIE